MNREGHAALCRSPEGSNACVVDFGEIIARRTFRIDAELVRSQDGATRTVSARFMTLDTHPAGDATSLATNVLMERTRAEARPPDHVMRLVGVRRVEGKGATRRVTYRDDLTQDNFEVWVRGIPGAKILSVRAPDPASRKLIPILFNVATYLVSRGPREGALDWQRHYGEMVATLIQGIRTAGRRGVDVEYVVAAYAATGRVFGPFRLHPGSNLDVSRQRSNDATLEELERFLTQPPSPRWNVKAEGKWVDNFGNVVHTLNDLYLRGYDGVVQGVWITDGWYNPSETRPRFQDDMWTEQLGLLNPVWSEARLDELLHRLDQGVSAHDEELSRYVGSLEVGDDEVTARVTSFLRELDPGATETLHAHRVSSSPLLNALFVPSDRSLRAHPQMSEFSTFVRNSYGGEIFRLLDREQDSGTEPLAELLQRTHRQLAHSYTVDVEVPNPQQDGASHTLRFEVVEASGKAGRLEGCELAYMPHYTSSRPVRSRLVDFLGSPFKDLRLLSAYELRNHWRDDKLYAAWGERWQVENDDQVRAMLFETWVVINLNRLQAGESPKAPRRVVKLARDALVKLREAGKQAANQPDPTLASEAAMLAEWYRADHPVPFREH